MEAWIIEEIERQERENNFDYGIPLQLPLPCEEFYFEELPQENNDRGVLIINIFGDEDEEE